MDDSSFFIAQTAQPVPIAALRVRTKLALIAISSILNALTAFAGLGILATAFGPLPCLFWPAGILLWVGFTTLSGSWWRLMLSPHFPQFGVRAAVARLRLCCAPGRHAVRAEEVALTVEVNGCCDTIPWTRVESVRRTRHGAWINVRSPLAAIGPFIPFKGFQGGAKAEPIIRLAQEMAEGQGQAVHAGVGGVMEAVSPLSTIEFGRDANDVESAARWYYYDKRAQAVSRFSALGVWAAKAAVGVMPWTGASLVALALCAIAFAYALQVLAYGSAASFAAAKVRRTFGKNLAKGDPDAVAIAAGLRVTVLPDGVRVSVRSSDCFRMIPWRAIKSIERFEGNIVIVGVFDQLSMPIFIPLRSFHHPEMHDNFYNILRERSSGSANCETTYTPFGI